MRLRFNTAENHDDTKQVVMVYSLTCETNKKNYEQQI